MLLAAVSAWDIFTTASLSSYSFFSAYNFLSSSFSVLLNLVYRFFWATFLLSWKLLISWLHLFKLFSNCLILFFSSGLSCLMSSSSIWDMLFCRLPSLTFPSGIWSLISSLSLMILANSTSSSLSFLSYLTRSSLRNEIYWLMFLSAMLSLPITSFSLLSSLSMLSISALFFLMSRILSACFFSFSFSYLIILSLYFSAI